MSEKRTIRATDIVTDIRDGMTHAELMNKYRLSSQGLQNALKRLGETQSVPPEGLSEDSGGYDDTVIIEDSRRLKRKLVPAHMAIYERHDLGIMGIVRDITERGVGIKGITATEGEIKTLVITPDEFVEVDPFEFEAVCRWVLETPDGERASGFEITAIGEKDLRELKKMINLID